MQKPYKDLKRAREQKKLSQDLKRAREQKKLSPPTQSELARRGFETVQPIRGERGRHDLGLLDESFTDFVSSRGNNFFLFFLISLQLIT